MQKTNKFDIIMDYIDENIKADSENIKKGIPNIIGYSSKCFGDYFLILTNITLFDYIRRRKLYFALEELKQNKKKRVCDIALEYGYSEQSAFTRAVKNCYDCTPEEIRNSKKHIKNNRYNFSDFNNNTSNSRIQEVLHYLSETGTFSSVNDANYFFEVENACDEYGFDIDTCYAIAELAERLELPFDYLINACWKLEIDLETDPNYISARECTMFTYGIESLEELKSICKHYNCQFYELDSFMVEAFRKEFIKED